MASSDEISDIPVLSRPWCASPWDDIIDDAMALMECSKVDIGHIFKRNKVWEEDRILFLPGEHGDDDKNATAKKTTTANEGNDHSDHSDHGDHGDHGDRSDHNKACGSQDNGNGESGRGTVTLGENKTPYNKATSFHFFSLLPPEIREQIWLATVDSVVVELEVMLDEAPGAPSPGHFRFRLTTPNWVRKYSEVPMYQPINREARSLALKHFGPPSRHALPFNANCDTVQFATYIPRGCWHRGAAHALWNWATRPTGQDCEDPTCDCSVSTHGLDDALIIIESREKFHRATPDFMARLRNLRITCLDNIPGIDAAQLHQSRLANLIVTTFPNVQEMRFIAPPLDDSALIGRAGYRQEHHRAYDWTRWYFLEALRNLGKDQGRGRQVPFHRLDRIVVELQDRGSLGVRNSSVMCWQWVAFDRNGRSKTRLSGENSLFYCEKGDERSIDRMMLEDGGTGQSIYIGGWVEEVIDEE